MTKQLILVAAFLLLFSTVAMSGGVVIRDFPIGVGGSVDSDFFKPYYGQLRTLADTLSKYELARAIVTGGADGQRYRQSNDAKNPSLALGRAHAMRNLLITEFGVDSAQIELRSEDVRATGGQYRYVSVRIERELVNVEKEMVMVEKELAKVEERVATVEQRPPIERHFTEVEMRDTLIAEYGMQVSGGFTSSPFGFVPYLGAGVIWKKTVFIEALVGHTFWNDDYEFEGSTLKTRRRMAGANVAVFPFDDKRLGFVAGWIRSEEISQAHYEYVRLSEGLMLGVRLAPFDYLSITGAYNPSKERLSERSLADTNNDQFMIMVTGHHTFGGGK